MKDKKQYGQTWWGKAWLKIVFAGVPEQTLKLGQTYVQHGGLTSFLFDSKTVLETSVKGVGDALYKQQVLFQPFSATQKELLLNLFRQQPNFLTQLLNRKFPVQIVTKAKSLDISILPEGAEAWHWACSCAARQLPCKHIAATIYNLVDKIDQNPFLLFEIRGLDLVGELEKEGISIKKEKEETIPSLRNFANDNQENCSYNIDLVKELDFSVVKNEWKQYLQLLGDETLFYQGDFKALLQKNCRKAAKIYQEQNFEAADFASLHQELKHSKDLAFILDESNQVINLFLFQKKENKPLFAKDKVLFSCIALLETVEICELERYPDAFIALHAIYRFSMKLLKEQNFLPRILTSAQTYWIQWIPAYTINKAVAELIAGLEKACPSDLLLLEGEKLTRFKPKEQILNLCHLFIGYYLQQATEMIPSEEANQQVAYSFFSGMPVALGAERATNIQLWLQQFYLGEQDFVPLLKVLESKGEEAEFVIQLLVQNKKEAGAKNIDLAVFLKQKKYAAHHFSVLRTLNRLADYFPDLGTVLAKEATRTPAYSGAEFEFVFFEILPILRMLNISIILPKSLKQLTKPSLGLSIGKKKEGKGKAKSFMNIKALLEVEWKVAIGEELLETLEFLKIIKGKSGLIKHKEGYILLEKEELEKILWQLKRPPAATANQLVQAALSLQYEGAKVEVSAEVQDLMQHLKENPLVAPPQSLQANLRPYQLVGYSWMFKNAQLGLGSLIADDMGLGKTLQVISLLLKFKEEGFLDGQQALVIVPTSLLTNWMNEIAKFAPPLQAKIYHGAKRKLSLDVDVLITTYGVARMDLKLLNQLDLYCTIIDEAQHIKNVNTAQTEAVKAIEAHLNIAMSGTPVENRLSEYWSIMDYVNPNYLGSIADFTEDFSEPIEKDNDQGKLDAFRKITAPFILRRLKSDKSIIQDLPDKIETNYYATLQEDQAAVYQKIVDDTLHELAKNKELAKEDEGLAKKRRQGLILKLMGGLKQVCNHPYQYMGMGRKGPECSGKSQILMDLLSRIHYQGEKTLIFTQYRKMGNLMQGWIQQQFGLTPMYLHGGCSRKQRDEMVEAFQHDKQQTIFILSLKAAGTGLNLTAANHVIHYDLWWNPAVEAQATDRAYRIGQKKNVQVYRFISKGTLEEKIDAMIQSKKELADKSVFIGEQWLGDLSNDELGDLLRLK